MQVHRALQAAQTRTSFSRHLVEATKQGTAARPALRKLGNSDLVVHEICLGTMTWGKQNSEAEAHAQLSYAIDERGVNFVDTAELYPVPAERETQGRTEQYIGTWLKKRGKRSDVVVATKVCGHSDRLTWFRRSGKGTRVNRDNIFEAVDKSLQRLQTDYIDLLQVHWPDRYVPLFGGAAYDVAMERDAEPISEQLAALTDLVKSGKVRHIGVSNETSWGVSEWRRIAKQSGMPLICSIQNSYSLIQRGAFETDLAETCSPRNAYVGLLAYSPLAGGALTGKYRDGNGKSAGPKSRFNVFQGYMERYNKSLAREAVAQYCEIASKHGLTPTQMALAFVKSRWFVASTIIGATTMEQLKANIDAFEVELSPQCIAEINALYKRYRDPATDA